jgi:hypothetical protein
MVAASPLFLEVPADVRDRRAAPGRRDVSAGAAGRGLCPRRQGARDPQGLSFLLGHFESWCGNRQMSALPSEPTTVALYITDLASCRAAGTITRRLTSITKAHQSAGVDTPATTRHLAVSETLKGIRRTIGTAQKRKAPLLTKDLKKIVDHLPAGLIGIMAIVIQGGSVKSGNVITVVLPDHPHRPLSAV